MAKPFLTSLIVKLSLFLDLWTCSDATVFPVLAVKVQPYPIDNSPIGDGHDDQKCENKV